MAKTRFSIELSWGNTTLRIGGHNAPSVDGYITQAGVPEGWYSAPDLKVSTTSRQAGHGGHDVAAADVLYEARVVTFTVGVLGNERNTVKARENAIMRMHHQLVTMRVIDGAQDTFCELGYAQVVWDNPWHEHQSSGTVNLTFQRPWRLSTRVHTATMVPSGAENEGGLIFDPVGSGDNVQHVLHWPITFGANSQRRNNVCTITNEGTATAMPILTASGNMPRGLTITNITTGTSLGHTDPVTTQPIVFDSRSQTATVNGVDVSRRLTSRSFPTIEPQQTITLAVQAQGSGQVVVTAHDTYI